MSIKKDLQRSIRMVLRHNRDGSNATQHDRIQILMHFADDVVGHGFGLRDIRGLKQKHIVAVVDEWKKKKLSAATLKNRLSAIRLLCEKINKPTITPNNDELKIPKRVYSSIVNRAVNNPDFSKISNPYIAVSLQLQRVFGLRREESLKIKPHMADKGEKLELLSSWCKGGRERSVPIRTEEQRYWLEQAKIIAKEFDSSLIPPEKNYIQQRYIYDKQVSRAGLRNLHGLRHAYAQQRYKEMTGFESPINGGPKYADLTLEQKEINHRARMILTEELGHSRESVTNNYLAK
jgi:site-specific recombinase XerC